jgi:hypothetical protein
MKRRVELPIALDDRRISCQRVITIDLEAVPMDEWCLNLCLLKEGLVDAVTFAGKGRLRIEVDQTIERARRARARSESDQVNLYVHPEELDFWVSFFLKAYRDGMAEAGHIDVEAASIPDNEEIYVTFLAGKSAPPMPGEEARKILDKYLDNDK